MHETSSSRDRRRRVAVRLPLAVTIAVLVIAVVALLTALYFARGFLLPVVLALIAALTLSPVVRFCAKRRLPPGPVAFVLVLLLAAAIVAGVAGLAQPARDWIDDAPRIAYLVKYRLQDLTKPIEAISQAEEQVQQLAEAGGSQAEEVVVREGGWMSRTADDLVATLATIVVTLALTFFMLASSGAFAETLVKVMPRLSEKKRALRIVRTTERTVSRYLFTIAAINLGLGVAVGLAMAALRLPDPVLWGVLAALLNFIPYLGAAVGIAILAVVSLITFNDVGYAVLAPLAYLALTALEGHFLTPAILGRRLELNTVVILVAVTLWGFLWGIVGTIIAVPLLIVVKVICDHVESLRPVSAFLGGASSLAAVAGNRQARNVGAKAR